MIFQGLSDFVSVIKVYIYDKENIIRNFFHVIILSNSDVYYNDHHIIFRRKYIKLEPAVSMSDQPAPIYKYLFLYFDFT